MSISKVPVELWDNNNIMYIPQELTSLYKQQLEHYGVYAKALKDYPPGGQNIYGGISDKDTLLHFVARYLGSSARIEYLTLGIEQNLLSVTEDIHTLLSDGVINILNIPCGTGADILSLFLTLIELRKNKVLPTLPINIRITAGDISRKAIEIYNEFLQASMSIIAKQGIHIQWNTFEWDVTREPSTAMLVDSFLNPTDTPKEYLVLTSAFGGSGRTIFDEINRSIQHIESRLYGKTHSWLWVEPVKNNFFDKIIRFFKQIAWSNNTESDLLTANFKWHHPFTHITHSGSMCVKKYTSALRYE